MADVIARFKGDTSDLDSKVKKASQELLQMEQDCRKLGGTFAVTDDEQMKWVKSLGSMETQAKSGKQQLRELSDAIVNLQGMYNRLSSEEKNSDFGKAMQQSLAKLTERAGEVKDRMDDTAAAIKNAASDTRTFSQVASGISTATSGFQVIQGSAKLMGIEMGSNVEILAKLQAAMAVTNGLQVIQNNLQKQSALMQGVSNVQKLAGVAAEKLATSAKVGGTVATKAATVAQAAFNAVAYANPYVLLAAAIVACGAAIYAFASNTDTANKNLKDLNDTSKSLAESQKFIAKTVSQAVGDVIGKYKALQAEWLAVRGTAGETQWIEKNKNAWEGVAGAINSVNEANDFYVRNSQRVIQAMIAVAVADKIKEKLADAMIQREVYRQSHSADTPKPYTEAKAGNVTKSEADWARKKYGTAYSPEALRAITESRKRTAEGKNDLEGMILDASVVAWDRLLNQSIEKAITGQLFLSSFGSNSGNGGSGSHGGSGSGSSTPLTELQKVTAAIQKLEAEAIDPKTTAERLTKIKEEVAVLDEKKQKLEEVVKGLHKEKAATIEYAEGLSGVSMSNIDVWMSLVSDRLENSDLGTEAGRIMFDNLTKNLADANAFKNIIEQWVKAGLDIADIDTEGIWGKIIGTDGDAIDNMDWQPFVDKINEKLKEINPDIDPLVINADGSITAKSKKKEDKDKLKDTSVLASSKEVLASLNNINGGLKELGIDLGSGFEQFLTKMNAVISIIEGVSAVVTTISGVLTYLAVRKSIPFFASGGVVRAAGGLTVPGNMFSGDNVPALLNSGEVVLNRAQVGNLASQLEGNPFGNLRLETNISAENIKLVLRNNGKRTGKSESIISTFK